MTWSIRWKVTLGTLVAVACGLLIAGVMTVQSLEQRYLAQFGDALEAKTKLVEYGFQPLFHSSSSPPTPSSLQETARDLGNRASARVTLVAADGTVLADSAVRDADVPAVENHTSQPEIQQALSTGQGEDIRPRHTTGERTMYRAVLLRQPQEAAPIAVRVGLPMVIVDREIAELKQHLLSRARSRLPRRPTPECLVGAQHHQTSLGHRIGCATTQFRPSDHAHQNNRPG